jgi:hypothetical protein
MAEAGYFPPRATHEKTAIDGEWRALHREAK